MVSSKEGSEALLRRGNRTGVTPIEYRKLYARTSTQAHTYRSLNTFHTDTDPHPFRYTHTSGRLDTGTDPD